MWSIPRSPSPLPRLAFVGAGLALLSTLSQPVLAQADTQRQSARVAGAAPGPVQPQPLDIYLDEQTGFVFVYLPTQWKFVGKVDPAWVRSRSVRVHTRLLPAEEF